MSLHGVQTNIVYPRYPHDGLTRAIADARVARRLGEGAMATSTLTKSTVTAPPFSMLHSGLIIRYLVRRPNRDCNYQHFYAEIFDLYQSKNGPCVLTHLQLNVEVGLHVRDVNEYAIPKPEGYGDAKKRFEQLVERWAGLPSPWRTEDSFVGVLFVGEERKKLPETSFLFSFYHAHIEAALTSLMQKTYIEVRESGWADEGGIRYDAAQQLDGRLSAFAATNYIARVVEALTDGF